MSDSTDSEVSPDDLSARIESHPGTRILRALRPYELLYDAFECSALQLRRLLLGVGDPADPHRVRTPDGEAARPALLADVSARFAKFLAASDTLIAGATALLTEEFVNETHRAEQDAESASLFAADMSRAFMRDYRKWSVNCQAKFSVESAGGPGGPGFEVVIDPMAMLGWAKWSSLARRFLHLHQPKVRLLAVTDESSQRLRAFHQRFMRRFRLHLGADMEAAKALMEEAYGPPGLPMMMSFP